MADIYDKIAYINDVYDAYKKGKRIRLQAPNSASINTVAGIAPEVETVSGISQSIVAVSTNAGNINAVANDISNINAVAADLTNIDNASAYAQLAQEWATKTDGKVDGSDYSAKYYAQQAAQAQVQANWNETDVNSKAYIQNKPTIPTTTDNVTQSSAAALTSGGAYDVIHPIELVIPSEATSTNQLADKAFVNSSIATNTANFIGTFANVSTLNSYAGTVTNNDYAFVINSVITDGGNDWASAAALNNYDKTLLTNFDYGWVINGANFDLYRFDILTQTWGLRASNIQKSAVTLNTAYNRYKATVLGGTTSWAWEYTLNNSSFTAAQWEAINSGITQGKVTLINSALQPGDNISGLTNDSGFIDSTSLVPYQKIAPAINPLSSSGSIALTDNSINSIATNGVVTFTLPAVTDNTKFHQVLVQLKLTNTSHISSSAIDNGALGTTDYFNKTKPDLSATGNYDLVYEYNSIEQLWEVGAISKGAAL